jgi:hypothetical protein
MLDLVIVVKEEKNQSERMNYIQLKLGTILSDWNRFRGTVRAVTFIT